MDQLLYLGKEDVKMSDMSSLFAQMRETRRVALNESKDEDPKDQEGQLNEGQQEEQLEEENEVTAIFCSECGELVSGSMNESQVDECPCCGSENLEERVVKVVRDGEVVRKNVPSKKRRMSSAQKAALAKARKKAHTSSANKKRNKSTAKGRKAGLHEEDYLVCPECGYEGEADDFSEDNKGNIICPECGATVCNEENGDKGKGKKAGKMNEGADGKDDLKSLLEGIEAPKFVFDALDEGKTDFVTGYINLKMKGQGE